MLIRIVTLFLCFSGTLNLRCFPPDSLLPARRDCKPYLQTNLFHVEYIILISQRILRPRCFLGFNSSLRLSQAAPSSLESRGFLLALTKIICAHGAATFRPQGQPNVSQSYSRLKADGPLISALWKLTSTPSISMKLMHFASAIW